MGLGWESARTLGKIGRVLTLSVQDAERKQNTSINE
jgi:hypothetical protein